jgi:hypothetical protein
MLSFSYPVLNGKLTINTICAQDLKSESYPTVATLLSREAVSGATLGIMPGLYAQSLSSVVRRYKGCYEYSTPFKTRKSANRAKSGNAAWHQLGKVQSDFSPARR